MDPWLAGGTPAIVRPTPRAVSPHSCGHTVCPRRCLVVLACRYPSHGKSCSAHVALVARALRAWRVGPKAHAALPRDAGLPGRPRQGHLARALGHGCRPRYRPWHPGAPRLSKESPFGNTTAGSDRVPRRQPTSRCGASPSNEDVLPGWSCQ